MNIRLFPLALVVCLAGSAQTTSTIQVGSGAPTVEIQQSFVSDFFRNGFSNLVALPPTSTVKGLGSQALIQTFSGATNSSQTYALIKPNISQPALAGGADMLQMYPALYSYYSVLGPATAGYPTTDTLNCPTLVTYPNNSCQYQLFTLPYALFVYASTLISGTTQIPLANPYYAAWQSAGGITALGPATAAALSFTSNSGIAATVQTFDQGAIFNMTSGVLSGRLVTVGPGIYPTYVSNGFYTGNLGLPLTNQQVLPSGLIQQSFEGGTIQYDPTGATAPVLLRAISTISVSPSGPVTLNAGNSVTLTASPVDINGSPLTGRTLSWTISNSTVASLQSSGYTATIKALSGGMATVTVTGETKSSSPITILVNATCCTLGQGAPNQAIQQAFQAAAARNQLNIQLPAPSSVTQTGNGYIQTVQNASNGASVLIALAANSATAYVVTGPLLAAYLQLGGPAGALGFPISDADAAGRQLFQNQAALAGSPVQLVSGPFYTKWASLNYEAGPAGLPTAPQSTALSFLATTGAVQNFANGVMAEATTGSRAGQVYFIGGAIDTAFQQAGGVPGSLGFPIDDQSVSSGQTQQDFEGGSVVLPSGATVAQVQASPRTPQVTATPSTVFAGTYVHLTVGGFQPGASIRVSITGQSPFVITAASGAYAWDAAIPSTAKPGIVSIQASATSGGASATGSYTISTAAATALKLTKAAGDQQNGFPGALLPQPLDVLVTDTSGNPISGLPVQFSASPGVQIVTASAITGATGHAQATVRLASSVGVALIAASAGNQVVTFSAQSQAGSLSGFPQMSQANSPATDVPLGNGPDTITQRGGLLAAAASILSYYQSLGNLPAPNGQATPTALNKFLQSSNGFLVQPGTNEQIVDLWRLAAFVGGNLTVSIDNTDPGTIRDLVGAGMPVLLALTPPASGSKVTPYVVAMGVKADSSVVIMDPNPAYGYSNLNSYLSAGSTITAAFSLLPRAPASNGFVVSGASSFQIASASAPCAPAVSFRLDDPPGGNLAAQFCDGTAASYQLDSTATGSFALALTSLGASSSQSSLRGSGPSSFALAASQNTWTATPQTANFTSAGVVNAASFTADIAPGDIVTIFGSGLSQAGVSTVTQLDGSALSVVFQTPFQLSAVLPPDLQPGSHSLTLTSPLGSVTQPFTVIANAPEVFTISGLQGAILNQDGSLNTPSNPASRGSVIVVYCTGLGSVVSQGSLASTTTPVLVILANTSLKPFFAGEAPGFPGLYQVNVQVPLATAPGLAQTLLLQQGAASSQPVEVAIQ